MIEVVLVQCNLVDNQYRQKSEVIYCTHSKSYAYLLNHSHTKRMGKRSGNGVTSFVYVMFLSWLVPSLSARGQNLAGSFNNISLNIKFWKKCNLKQPIMNEASYFIFYCSSSKKIIWCLYFESVSRRQWMVFYTEEGH